MTGHHCEPAPIAQVQSHVSAAIHLNDDSIPSPGLPEGIWRDQYLELIITVHRRDLTPADERVLRHYAHLTRPKDWSDQGGGPVCYTAQRSTAQALNLNRKSIYNAERKLEELGLVARITLPNGHRRGPRGSRHVSEPLGIAFYPAISAHDALLARAAAIKAETEAYEKSRRTLLRLRARVMSLLRTSPRCDPSVEAIRAAFDKLPRRLSRISNSAQINALTASFQNLLDDLRMYLADISKSVDDVRREINLDPEITHKGGTGSPCHIYTTTNTSSVTCTSHEEKSPGANAPDTHAFRSACAGEEAKKKHARRSSVANPNDQLRDSPPAPVNWQIRDLVRAAGPNFLAYLNLFEPNMPRLRANHFVDAASELAAAIGIHQSAWQEACVDLGQFDAALAVLVLDANRDHPDRPVSKPGGALRGMLRKHRVGALNIDASVFALLRRRAGAKVSA